MSKVNKLTRGKPKRKLTPLISNNKEDDSDDDFSSLTSQNMKPDSQIMLNNHHSQDSERLQCPKIEEAIPQRKSSTKKLSDIFEEEKLGSENTLKDVSNSVQSRLETTSEVTLPLFCPLCNKASNPGHLKSCASKRGLTTQQTLELRIKHPLQVSITLSRCFSKLLFQAFASFMKAMNLSLGV